MTKEYVLEKHCDKNSTFLHLQNGNNVIDGDANSVFDAMDEYAKEIAIGYAHWVLKKTFPKVIRDEATEEQKEKLYNQYLQSLTELNK